MLPVAMDEDADNKKSAPRGSPKPAPDEKHHRRRPSPANMQNAPAHPPQHQQPPHQQYYPPPNGQHLPSPDFRGSPPGAAPMSLPSIQHFEGASLQSQPQYIPTAHMNGAPPMMHAPPYNPGMIQYQPQSMPPPMPSNAPNGHNGMMRYPIPPQAAMDARQMSGGRHKKEIKRRTKTGCLTCRKRRIKCDEGHPTCRNCQKSKRACLGYDPIFKQQSAPPPSIQPAPVSNTPTVKGSPTATVIPPNSYPPYHGGGDGYGHQLPHHAAPLDGPISYHAPVDSVLSEQDSKVGSVTTNNYAPTLHAARRSVKVTIDELINLNDIPPQLPIRNTSDLPSPENLKELESLYNFQYAQALDKLFETTWYSTRGFAALSADRNLCEFAAQCMEEMRARSGPYGQSASMPALASLEARLVWSFAVMPRTQHAQNASDDPVISELLSRLDTLEHLLTGSFLDFLRAPRSPIPGMESHPEQVQRNNQQAFWYHLGKFTSLRDDQGDAHALDQISAELTNLRMILNVLESRDVLYSIAVMRHIGGRFPEWSPQNPHVPLSNDPTDDLNKLHVAYDFVQTEDQRGTSQVIQRICSMALRSWILQTRAQ